MGTEFKIFKSSDGEMEVQVVLKNETLWLNQYQLSDLFHTNRTSIGKHISNIYRTEELNKKSTCAKIAQVKVEGDRTIHREILHYNLDIIIAVGYRINSKRGTEFRIWANKVLKDYLVKGYALNEQKLQSQNKQLKELQSTIKMLRSIMDEKNLSNDESQGLLKLISDYAYALEILDDYDYQKLKLGDKLSSASFRLTYVDAISQINKAKKIFGNSSLFGNEKDGSFKGSIKTIYQTFNGEELYPTLEEKAAHLLYFITKNHSFSDGNKRIAALIFLYFMEKNGVLYHPDGRKRIADNVLVALTLMIAVSKPEEKDTMIKVVVNLINSNNDV